MPLAHPSHKPLIIDILSATFDTNKSVNWLAGTGRQRTKNIRHLCAYSYELCSMFGEVYMSADRKACALVLLPDQKKLTAKSLALDLQLVFQTIGLLQLPRALKREATIKKAHPQGALYHIWYIGVEPAGQGKGLGTTLLRELLQRARQLNRLPVLETSTLQNLPWYRQQGFELYRELELGYRLYCLKAAGGERV